MNGIPDFFIVGAPKCGTTTLYRWLGEHPQIHAPHKEPCFFSQDIYPTDHVPTHIPSLSAYCSIFKVCDPEKRVSGEATPKYLYSDLALDRISELRPDARLVVCLRDPVDLMISLHSQKLREGEEKELRFQAAWKRSFGGNGGTPVYSEPTVRGEINYLFWGGFGKRLARLQQIFAPENIHIVTLAGLKEYPFQVYSDLLAFIGVENDGRTDFSASNKRVKIRNLRIHRSVLAANKMLAPVLAPIRKARGGRGLGAMKWVDCWNVEKGSYSSAVSEELRKEMYHVLREDMELAEFFLNGRPITNRKEERRS